MMSILLTPSCTKASQPKGTAQSAITAPPAPTEPKEPGTPAPPSPSVATALSPGPSEPATTPPVSEAQHLDNSTPPRPLLSKEQQQDIDALAREILAGSLFGKRNLPDLGLLPKRGPIFVLNVPTTPLTEDAFPPKKNQRLQLATLAELQALANQRDTSIAFVELDISITGDSASVRSGVDIVLPSREHGMKLCCCVIFQYWHKTRGRWRINRKLEGSSMCS